MFDGVSRNVGVGILIKNGSERSLVRWCTVRLHSSLEDSTVVGIDDKSSDERSTKYDDQNDSSKTYATPCTNESKVNIVALREVHAVHCDLEVHSLFVDVIGVFRNGWCDTLNSCFVDEDCLSVAEAAELALESSEVRGSKIDVLFDSSVDVEAKRCGKRLIEHVSSFFVGLNNHGDLIQDANLTFSWLNNFDGWLLIETEFMGSFCEGVKSITSKSNSDRHIKC